MISHHHKTVFVHIPKCGGTSIERAFLNDIGLDMKGRDAFCMRSNDDPAMGPRVLDHMTAREYVDHHYVAPWQREDYYWFSVVRCPIKRVLSTYNYFGLKMELSRFIQDWIPKQFESRFEPKNKDRGHHYFMRPQCEFIYDGAGNQLVDDIFRLEDLKSRGGTIAEKSGLKSPIKHENKSHRDNKTIDDLSSADIAVITEIYQRDFKVLDYPSH